MLVIAVALIFFHLGKTTHPTFTFQKQPAGEVRMASPIFPVPKMDSRRKVTKSQKQAFKAKHRVVATRKRTHAKRVPAKAPSIGAGPKLVRE